MELGDIIMAMKWIKHIRGIKFSFKSTPKYKKYNKMEMDGVDDGVDAASDDGYI
jgi:hypothetical protein